MNLLVLLLGVTFYMAPNGSDANGGRSPQRPVATLSRAVALTRNWLQDGPKTIELADGTYFVDAPVELQGKDYDLTICARNKGKAVLTGAIAVSGWRQDSTDGRFLVADLPFTPDPNMLYVLIVNGMPAEFSAYPQFSGGQTLRYFSERPEKGGDNRTVLRYDRETLPKGVDFRDLDITSVWVYIPQEWATTRTRIITNDWRRDTFVLETPTAMPLGRFNQGYRIVNARLGMRGPGSWMYEGRSRKVIYWPRKGETATGLKASVSHSVGAFQLWGDGDAVHGFRVSGLVFEGFAAPLNYTPYGTFPYPAAIAGACRNSVIEDCEVRYSAGDGFAVMRANRTMFRRCHVHHVGGVGIHFSHGGDGFCSVVSSDVHHIGTANPGSAGIVFQVGANSRCIGNRIHEVPGPGVTVWSSQFLFASNVVWRTMQNLQDAGGLYGAYDHSMVCDNCFYENGNWPAIYCDEGGQQTVFTGNYTKNSWWPIHMHDTWGLVITNNVFESNGAMRYSLLGSTRAVFSNNVLRTNWAVSSCEHVTSCDVWMDNPVYCQNSQTGGWERRGTSTIPREPEREIPVAGAVRTAGPLFDGKGGCNPSVIRTPGSLRAYLMRNELGLRTFGKPFSEILCGYDDDYLYLDGLSYYGRFTPYEGSVNIGERWGRHDAVRLYFADFNVTVFFTGKIVSSDPGLTFDGENSQAHLRDWTHAEFRLRIPLARLGLDGKAAKGRTVRFNAVSFNGDHREYKYFREPGLSGEVQFGILRFE